jgi:hypothetical protein
MGSRRMRWYRMVHKITVKSSIFASMQYVVLNLVSCIRTIEHNHFRSVRIIQIKQLFNRARSRRRCQHRHAFIGVPT